MEIGKNTTYRYIIIVIERKLAEHKTEPDKPDRRVKTDIRPISSHVTHDKKFYILIILTIRMDRIEHLKNQDGSHQCIHFCICHSLPFKRGCGQIFTLLWYSKIWVSILCFKIKFYSNSDYTSHKRGFWEPNWRFNWAIREGSPNYRVHRSKSKNLI